MPASCLPACCCSCILFDPCHVHTTYTRCLAARLPIVTRRHIRFYMGAWGACCACASWHRSRRRRSMIHATCHHQVGQLCGQADTRLVCALLLNRASDAGCRHRRHNPLSHCQGVTLPKCVTLRRQELAWIITSMHAVGCGSALARRVRTAGLHTATHRASLPGLASYAFLGSRNTAASW